mgnify:FL=1
MITSLRKPPSRCKCGKIKSRHMIECRDCHKAKRDASLAEARRIVATGKCPTCGRPLRRNLSMTGWWQCEQLGAETHRADPLLPSCNFQTFTE